MTDEKTPPAPLPPLLLVGCGQMGGAMLAGWQADGLAPSVILDRHRDDIPAPHTVVGARPGAGPPAAPPPPRGRGRAPPAAAPPDAP
ncbi:MAG: hypothetical protein ABF665_08855, partial [Gluconacetobacter sp.]